MSKQAAYVRIRSIKMLYKGSFRLMMEDYTKKDAERRRKVTEKVNKLKKELK